MNIFTKPANEDLEELINMIVEATEMNKTVDETDYDSVLGMIWKLKEIKDIIWRADTDYHILLNRVNRS